MDRVVTRRERVRGPGLGKWGLHLFPAGKFDLKLGQQSLSVFRGRRLNSLPRPPAVTRSCVPPPVLIRIDSPICRPHRQKTCVLLRDSRGGRGTVIANSNHCTSVLQGLALSRFQAATSIEIVLNADTDFPPVSKVLFESESLLGRRINIGRMGQGSLSVSKESERGFQT